MNGRRQKRFFMLAVAALIGLFLFTTQVRAQDQPSDSTTDSSTKTTTKKSKPAPAAAPAAAPTATNTPAPAKPAKTSAGTTTPPPAGSGMVWVNTDSGVYHKEGTRYYGKTKSGKYMSEADAQKAGYRVAKNDQ
jgi:hypothetical protein